MLDVQTERVLVVPTPVFHELGHFQGMSTDVDRYLEVLLRPEHISYRPRAEVEEDPTFKQLIPYVIFRHIQADGTATLFHYLRGKGQGESRLRLKRSIGIGGHISAVDAESRPGSNPYLDGMQRELDEEVHIGTSFERRCLGLINDDESAVGRVHLGVVHLFDVAEPRIEPREDDIIGQGFVPPAELHACYDEFETWSQICLKTLFPLT